MANGLVQHVTGEEPTSIIWVNGFYGNQEIGSNKADITEFPHFICGI